MKEKLVELHYGEKIIPCSIKRKRMKSISFRLSKDGTFLQVSCPYLVPDKYIFDKINEYLPKLLAKSNYQKPINGDKVFIFGEEKEINGFSQLNEKEQHKLLKDILLPYCQNKVREYEKFMNIVNPYLVKVRSMSSRYGVNNHRNHSLTFTLSLVHYSFETIDAVIVHELAHDFVSSHNKEFYNIVYKFYPTYKENHKKLRKHIYK